MFRVGFGCSVVSAHGTPNSKPNTPNPQITAKLQTGTGSWEPLLEADKAILGGVDVLVTSFTGC